MRITQWMISLFLATSLCAASAMAADAAPATEQAQAVKKLEEINAAPAAGRDMKDCPMHQGKEECDHKKGEPCPYHQGEKHHGMSHEKCDHEQHNG